MASMSVLAPIAGSVIGLVGLALLVAFWQSWQRRRAVRAVRERGPRPVSESEVGNDLWMKGLARVSSAQTHPITGNECVHWSVVVTHLVWEKISNDAGSTQRRRELYSKSAGNKVRVVSKDGTVELDINQCDNRTCECDSYTADDLPDDVRAWLKERGVSVDGEGLEVDIYYIPVGAKVSALGRVYAVGDDGVRHLDDIGATGLALSVGELDEYITQLGQGQLATLVLGLGFVLAGAALIGRFFAA
jgi:hypothetical protein